MARGIKEITTKKSGNVVVIKEWLNKGEELELIKFFATRAKEVDGNYEAKDPVSIIDYYKLLVSVWVMSVDGVKEKVLENMLELHPSDYDEVIAFIKSEKDVDEEKKTKEVTNTGDSSQVEAQTLTKN
jgi:hypothetical protein